MIEKSPNSEIGNDVNNEQKNQESLYREIDRLVSQHKVELVEVRHHLHANPELSKREEKTSALVAEHLRSLGLDEVRTGIAGHGVVGVLHGRLPGDRVIGQLYRQVPAFNPVTVTIGHVEDVGRFNIVGQSVTLWGTIRCIVDTDMANVQQHLERLAEHQAAAYGCTATVEYLQSVPPVHSTQAWIEALLQTLRRVVGDDNVQILPPNLGYDDVAVFVNAFGGAYVTYGVRVDVDHLVAVEGGRGIAPNHNPGFYADDDSLAGSVRVHAHVAVDHLIGTLNVNT